LSANYRIFLKTTQKKTKISMIKTIGHSISVPFYKIGVSGILFSKFNENGRKEPNILKFKHMKVPETNYIRTLNHE
jgi:hypothetical protein